MDAQPVILDRPETPAKAGPGLSLHQVLARRSPIDGCRFGVVRSVERLDEILELRLASHRAAGLIHPQGSVTDLADPRDLQATTVFAESMGRMVAATRLVTPLPGTILHQNCQLTGPLESLPAKRLIVENAFICVHPDHQGRGLFWPLVAHMLLAAQTFGRPYLVGAANARMLGTWEVCGYRGTKVTYEGAVTGIEYRVMLLDLAKTLAGRTIGPQLARVLRPLQETVAEGS